MSRTSQIDRKHLVTLRGPDAQKLLDTLAAGYSFIWYDESTEREAVVEIWEEE